LADLRHKIDFLVLGSGAAGLSFAIQVAEFGTVAVVTKDQASESNTQYAQGGIAAVMDVTDSIENHVRDTLDAGAGLCDEEVVRIIVEEGPAEIRRLVSKGALFSKENGHLHLGREGGHRQSRIVHAADSTGEVLEQTLLQKVMSHTNIQILEHHFALELITDHHLGQHVSKVRPDISCYGAYVYNEAKDQVETWLAKCTMLATGGAGQVYLHTTNPGVATGDGVAMAYRAKARVANMEFVQFHPTSLFHEEARSFLISEAVRGEGGVLTNTKGQRFMPEYDKRAELAPRDIVARAIDDQLKTSGDSHVWLDISHKSSAHVKRHFPKIYSRCLEVGIDITKQKIPVVPAAHYMCGGVYTDVNGQTSIDRLLACGEVSCTGLHGANRLASNSLLEALVVGRRSAEKAKMVKESSDWMDSLPNWDDSGTIRPGEWVLISHNKDELRRIMWDYVGIVRSNLRLERASRRLELLYKETEAFYRDSRVSVGLCELRNMIAVGYLIVRSASMRRESRGLHFITDYPETSENERRMTLI